MFKNIIRVLAIAFAIFHGHGVLAHGDHEPIVEAQAIAIAMDAAQQFATFDPGLDFGVLPASWKRISAASVTIAVRTDSYYIVRVENATEGKALYILMSDSGAIYDANFTGNFPKVE